jgi:hypothetical protein
MYALRPPRPELGSLNHVARGPRGRSRTIDRSTLSIMGTAEITGIVSSNPQIKRRKGLFIIPLMQKSGARFIVPMDMIWKSTKLF